MHQCGVAHGDGACPGTFGGSYEAGEEMGTISPLNPSCFLCVLSHYIVALYFKVLHILHAGSWCVDLKAAAQIDPGEGGNKPSTDRKTSTGGKYLSETICHYYIC